MLVHKGLHPIKAMLFRDMGIMILCKERPWWLIVGDNLEGKIMAHPCRTPLFPPTRFDYEAALARSGAPPDAHLEIEAVHGYAGRIHHHRTWSEFFICVT